MKDPYRKIIVMQWIVIGVLVAGAVTGGFMVTKRADDLSAANGNISGDNASLRNQLKYAKEHPTPEPSVTPTPKR